MASYYKKIKGKNYDRKVIDLADSYDKGKGESIPMAGAKKIITAVKDGNQFTDVEKRTVEYIISNYKIAKDAGKYIRTEIKKLNEAERKKSVKPKSGPAAKKKTPVKKKTAVKKKVVKKSVNKKTVTPTAPETKAVEKTAAPVIKSDDEKTTADVISEKPKKGSSKFAILVVIMLAIAALIYFLAPKFKKKAVIDKPQPAEKLSTVDSKVDVETKENTGEDKKETKKIEAVDIKEKKESSPKVVQEAGPDEYIVKSKDTLVEISFREYGNYKGWKKIYDANRDIIKNPVIIFPGQKLKIPGKNK